ncbi:hypothetical protein RCS94_04605 [Orbaceae bacterium ac157xtp]
MKKMAFICGLCCLVIGCSSTTDPNWRPDMTTANFGKYPTNYPEIIKNWGGNHFDNAKSINYLSLSTPREEYLVTDSEKQQAIYGYSVCANIAGIKSEGMFKPFKQYWFFIRNGKVIEQRDIEFSYNRVIYKEHKINCDDPH